jgi:uncharacterized paraquat-inducible protein A
MAWRGKMIHIDYVTGFIIYIFIWLLTIGILWAKEIWRVKAYDWAREKDKLSFCENCHYAFLAKYNENIARCPRCNEIVIINKRRSV